MSVQSDQPLLLPPTSLPEGTVSVNERVWFVERDGHVSVFHLGIALYHFDGDDVLTRRFVCVRLRTGGHATQAEVAAAFGHSVRSQARWEEKYREEQLDGLVDGRPTGRPRGVSSSHRVFLVKWFEQGVSNRQIADRLGVSEATIRRDLARLGLARPSPRQQEFPEAGEDPDTSPSEPVTADVPRVLEEEEEEDAEPSTGPVAPPGTLDRDPLHREMDRTLACAGLIDDAVPFFADAQSLPRAGVLLCVPLLVRSGALEEFQRIYGSLGPAFYGLRTTVVMLFLFALLRIKRPENVKEYSPSELGRILGLDRAAEVKTLRRKLRRLAAAKKGEELMHALAQRRVDEDAERLGLVFVDGHVREYSGRHPLGKAHVTARRISAPAATDTWVNDAMGDPLFLVTSELNAGLTKMLPSVLAEVRRLAGPERRVTVVFDRGGYSPRLFARIVEMGFDVLTYRKGKRDPIGADEFETVHVEDEDGTREEIRLNDKRQVPVGVKRRLEGEEEPEPWLRMRQVSKLRDDGDMTQVLTTREDLEATEVLSKMFSRWVQENFFKYMLEEFALDGLTEYGAEKLSDGADRPNPERRKLKKHRARRKAHLKTLFADLGERVAGDEESSSTTVRRPKTADAELIGQIADVTAEIEELTARIRALPARVSADDLCQLKRDRKLVVDSIKMVAYQAESDLHRMLVGRYPRAEDEGRTLLHGIFQSSARIEVGTNELRVTIAAQSSPHKTAALKGLCESLNELGVQFPGSDLRLVLAAEQSEHATI